jgi:tetratricopeptide (TPR) repeat protein
MAVSPSSAGSSSPAPETFEQAMPTRKKEAPLGLALLVMVFCLIVISGAVAFGVYPHVAAKYHWEQAKKALANNDLARAEDHLTECLKAWNNDGEVQFAMARTERRNGKLDPAFEHLLKAKKLKWVPEQIKLENALIKAQRIGYLPDVTHQLETILREGHQDYRYILEALIIGDIQTNFFTEANRWALVWIDRDSDDWLARYWHGVVLDVAGQFATAKEEYRKALELNPEGKDTHLRLAELLLHEKAADEAIAHYEATLAGDPDNAVALLGLARCQHSLEPNDLSKAKATLDGLIQTHPNFVGAYTLYSQLEDEEDRLEEALQWLKKAKEIDPNDRLTNQRLFDVLRRLNRQEEAQEIQRRTREQERLLLRLDEIAKEILGQPKDVPLRVEAGNILLQLGKHNEAFHWFVSAYLIDKNDQPAKEGMRKCLQKTGDKELLELYRPYLSEQPKSTENQK